MLHTNAFSKVFEEDCRIGHLQCGGISQCCFEDTRTGLGIWQNAQCMVFAVSMDRNSALKMGFLHASYGTGAFAAPLVATQFAAMPRWSFHFLISLGIAIINLASLTLVFKLQDLACELC